MKQLIEKIEQWAEDRNLIKGCEPIDQAMKLFSEFGELSDAVAKDDLEGIKDGIGDVFVVTTILCRQNGEDISPTNGYAGDQDVKNSIVELGGYLFDISDSELFNHTSIKMAVSKLAYIAEEYGFTLQQCVEHAYNEIKDRKGIMYNGTFIKESDARYKELTK